MNSFPSETNDEFAKEIKPIQLALELSTAVDDIVNNSVDLAFNELKSTIRMLKSSIVDIDVWSKRLIDAWKILSNILRQDSGDLNRALQLTVKFTLDSMLTLRWGNIGAQHLMFLRYEINACIPLLENNPNALYRCEYILENMQEPWSHPTLNFILNSDEKSIVTVSDEQLNKEIEYFTMERGCMIEMRAQKLIESRTCDDMALRFICRALRAIRTCTDDHMLRKTVSCRQLQSLLECYLSLLYKMKRYDKLRHELESMDLESVREFIVNSFWSVSQYLTMNHKENCSTAKERNREKKTEKSWIDRLLKYHLSVCKYAVQLILTRILNEEYKNENLNETLGELLGIWIKQNRQQPNFNELFRRLVQTSKTSAQIYNCCEYFYRMFPQDCEAALQIFCSELTKEINKLEVKKYDMTAGASVILNLEKQISSRYLFLGGLLSNYPGLQRECILTAFSMNPTQENFDKVHSLCDDYQINYMQNNDLQTTKSLIEPVSSLENSLDSLITLSEVIKSDLMCLLNVPRIKNLNWLLSWPNLKRECEELLQTEKKERIVENWTAKANEKLKFINLNYEEYRDFRPHEYPGIEKGYEIYIAENSSSESHAIDKDSDDTDTASESKNYIVKEARRIKNRKRQLIRRSQKLLALSESRIQNNNTSIDKAKKPKLAKRHIVDGLKPRGTHKSLKRKSIELQKLYTSIENVERVTAENNSNVETKIGIITATKLGNQINNTEQSVTHKALDVLTLNDRNNESVHISNNECVDVQCSQSKPFEKNTSSTIFNEKCLPIQAQLFKPKNPLLSFRKPKKSNCTNVGLDDSRNSSILQSSSTYKFGTDSSEQKETIRVSMTQEWHESGKIRNKIIENSLQKKGDSLSNTDSNGDEKQTAIVILTKHCTVRLHRIPDQKSEIPMDNTLVRDVSCTDKLRKSCSGDYSPPNTTRLPTINKTRTEKPTIKETVSDVLDEMTIPVDASTPEIQDEEDENRRNATSTDFSVRVPKAMHSLHSILCMRNE